MGLIKTSMFRHLLLLILCLQLASCTISLPKEVEVAYSSFPDEVTFNLDIKPILSDKCYQCHGPDDNKRIAGLRLDTEEGIFSKNQTGTRAFVPKNLRSSEAIARILSNDPETVMPPPESKISLSNKEKALLVKWVEQGAKWNEHWAFIPPKEKISVPPKNTNWIQNNAIDNFIQQKLSENALHPAEEASKLQLLRRVTMDLTGLPPTSAEIDLFLNDPAENAYENLVDRLLETDAFAERMTLEWLDVARYADSHGLHADGIRNAYPWRDWVIKAFRDNMPYDQFITEQLAGDLLPNPTRDQLVATAFNRNHPMTGEGGVIEEEIRVDYVTNRTNTVGTAVLGLTLECAKCHDHKFDPISQKEYFKMSSFFNNVKELGMTANDGDFGPIEHLTTKEQDSILSYIDKLIKEQSNQYETEKATLSKPLVYLGFENIKEKGAVDGNTLVTASGKLELVEGKNGNAASFDHMYDNIRMYEFDHFESTTPFTVSMWSRLKKDTHKTKALIGNVGEKAHRWKGWEVYLDSINRPAIKIVSELPHNYIHVSTKDPVPLHEWRHITASYDGSMSADGVSIYVNGEPVATKIHYDALSGSIKRDKKTHVIVGKAHRRFTGDNGIFTGDIDELYVYDGFVSQHEAKKVFETSINTSNITLLANNNSSVRKKKIAKLIHQKIKLLDTVPAIMVMKDMPKKRKTYVLNRGAYDDRGEEVSAGTIAKVLPFDTTTYAGNRLGLSKWLFDSKNPLTARVAVNRYWQMIFGTGIVSTPEDFGNQGALPSHPKLLDWLAVAFKNSGWDVRQLIKRMVMSYTYKQSSYIDAEKYALDPTNNWLSRAPRYRLQAEFIRDNALASSGLLNKKVGGKSSKPYQPKGLWIEVGNYSQALLHYKKDKGKSQYRRSMYTFIRRTAPPPFMTIFDAPNREVCTVKRESTNTPLQALVLLNDPQFVEAARALASRLGEEYGDDFETILNSGFLLALTREASHEELEILKNLYHQQLAHFEKSPDELKNYLAVGDFKVPPHLDKKKVAALAVVCSTILNMDEAYTKS